ncbi:hypothetical protein [Methylobacterium ajmalii]|uniref:hypothetical protein n=1 Tax=Methylobacterium ajmalii TaxID=2738439 RepID=UPI002F3560AB
MGYTHYWTHKKQLTTAEWAEFMTGMYFLYEHAAENGIKLVSEQGETTPPLATAEVVRFNGLGEEACEDHLVSRKRHRCPYRKPRDPLAFWTFTKTNNNDYDLIVTASLAYLDSIHPEAYVVDSDGTNADWGAGVGLARMAWPHKGNQIDIPRAVRDTSRYASYPDIGKHFQVARDHDGVLWIEDRVDRSRIQLDDAWYEERMKNLPYDERASGSFRGGEYERCTKKRLERIWLNRRVNDCPIVTPDRFLPLPA